jgi:hypothetical protein
MSTSFDLSSTHRNRRLFPNQCSFSIPVQEPSSDPQFFLDPVLNSTPYTFSPTKDVGELKIQGTNDSTHIILDSADTSVDNRYIGSYLKLNTEYRIILSYSGTSKVASITSAYTTLPAPNSLYDIVKSPGYFNSAISVIDGDTTLNSCSKFNLLSPNASDVPDFYTNSFFTYTNGDHKGEIALVKSYTPTTNIAAFQQPNSPGMNVLLSTASQGFCVYITAGGIVNTINLYMSVFDSTTTRNLTVTIRSGKGLLGTVLYSDTSTISTNYGVTQVQLTTPLSLTQGYYTIILQDNSDSTTGYFLLYGDSYTGNNSIITPPSAGLSYGFQNGFYPFCVILFLVSNFSAWSQPSDLGSSVSLFQSVNETFDFSPTQNGYFNSMSLNMVCFTNDLSPTRSLRISIIYNSSVIYSEMFPINVSSTPATQTINATVDVNLETTKTYTVRLVDESDPSTGYIEIYGISSDLTHITTKTFPKIQITSSVPVTTTTQYSDFPFIEQSTLLSTSIEQTFWVYFGGYTTGISTLLLKGTVAGTRYIRLVMYDVSGGGIAVFSNDFKLSSAVGQSIIPLDVSSVVLSPISTYYTFGLKDVTPLYAVPSDMMSYATYASTLNLNYGGGTLTGTPLFGAAISGGYLDLAHDDSRLVKYSATGNMNFGMTGTIRFSITPNYSGIPTHNLRLITLCSSNLTNENSIVIIHDGSIRIHLYDGTGDHWEEGFGWLPTSGVEYELEFDFNFAGTSYAFVDGTPMLSFNRVFTRTNTTDLCGVGGDPRTGFFTYSNQKIRNLVFYNTVQHTWFYTPPARVLSEVPLISGPNDGIFLFGGSYIDKEDSINVYKTIPYYHILSPIEQTLYSDEVVFSEFRTDYNTEVGILLGICRPGFFNSFLFSTVNTSSQDIEFQICLYKGKGITGILLYSGTKTINSSGGSVTFNFSDMSPPIAGFYVDDQPLTLSFKKLTNLSCGISGSTVGLYSYDARYSTNGTYPTGEFYISEVIDPSMINDFTNFKFEVRNVTFDSDMKAICVCDRNFVHMYNTQTNETKMIKSSSGKQVFSCIASSDLKYIMFSEGESGVVNVYNSTDGGETFSSPRAVSPGENIISCMSDDGHYQYYVAPGSTKYVYSSEDYGETFSNTGISGIFPRCDSTGQYVYLLRRGVPQSSIVMSSDYIHSVTTLFTSSGIYYYGLDVSRNRKYLILGADNVTFSSDFGATFNVVNVPGDVVSADSGGGFGAMDTSNRLLAYSSNEGVDFNNLYVPLFYPPDTLEYYAIHSGAKRQFLIRSDWYTVGEFNCWNLRYSNDYGASYQEYFSSMSVSGEQGTIFTTDMKSTIDSVYLCLFSYGGGTLRIRVRQGTGLSGTVLSSTDVIVPITTTPTVSECSVTNYELAASTTYTLTFETISGDITLGGSEALQTQTRYGETIMPYFNIKFFTRQISTTYIQSSSPSISTVLGGIYSYDFTPSLSGTITTINLNYSSFSSRTLRATLKDGGTSLFSRLLYLSSKTRGIYPLNIYTFGITFSSGHTYTLYLEDITSSSAGEIRLYGITSDVTFVSHNTSIYPTMNIYESNPIAVFSNTLNPVISQSLTPLTEYGMQIIASFTGLLSGVNVELFSFDTTGSRQMTFNLYSGSGFGGTLLYTTPITIKNSDVVLSAGRLYAEFPVTTALIIDSARPYTISLVDSGSESNGNILFFGITTVSPYVSYNMSMYPRTRLNTPSFVIETSQQVYSEFLKNNLDNIEFNLTATNNSQTILIPSLMGDTKIRSENTRYLRRKEEKKETYSYGEIIKVNEKEKKSGEEKEYYNSAIRSISTSRITYYEVKFLYISIPNQLLTSGGRLLDYPYIFLELLNEGYENNSNLHTTNNPNMRYCTFTLPVDRSLYNVPTNFYTIKATDELKSQIMLIRPDQNMRVNIRLPNGDLIAFVTPDNLPPLFPNPLLQIDMLFDITPLIYR